MVKEYTAKSEQEMVEIAQKFAQLAKKGDVFALSGTLGAGKSVFARGFIQSLCGACDVPSPTFTLVQIYPAPEFDIYHYDLYRLKEAHEIFELGVEDAFYDGVCLVEWPEKMKNLAPRGMWKITIEIIGNIRKITVDSDDADKIERLSNAG